MKSKSRKDGFTLVELMVVAIIVAILAAVAVPLMSANRKRAIITEAEAGCGTIRTALRIHYAQHGDYPASGQAASLDNVGAGDLDGTWFRTANYVDTVNGTNYTIRATGVKDPIAGVIIELDQAGEFTYQNL